MAPRKIIFLFTVFLIINKSPTMSEKGKSALVFGGNGFIGSESVIWLLEEKFEVTCVSRGNWYWDSESRIKPFVNHFQCDRSDGLERCTQFIRHVEELQNPFDVVIDFSGYRPEIVENTLRTLNKHIKLYIFISSDSVYEVSKPKSAPGTSKEEDSVRPNSIQEQNELNRLDSYGHRKLVCEEVITKHSQETGTPFVILRLPDVIGPRDTTNRWWVYQLWIQFYHQINKPLIIPPDKQSLATSYVYVKDVAKIITKIIKNKDNVKNEIFNVALDESLTLIQLLSDMALNLHMNQVHLGHSSNPSAFFLFPSVTRGAVNNTKVKTRLQWQPTSWYQVLSETTEFYKSAIKYFPRERADAVDTLLSYVVSEEKKFAFLNALEAAEREVPPKEAHISENNKLEL